MNLYGALGDLTITMEEKEVGVDEDVGRATKELLREIGMLDLWVQVRK